jgi:AbrB family looped-hinge helix DNA binding protein
MIVDAMIGAMTVRIDRAGRIAVPKRLRQRLRLGTDTTLEAVEQADGILLRPVRQRRSMVKVDGLWVHSGTAVRGADWDRIVDEVGKSAFRPL